MHFPPGSASILLRVSGAKARGDAAFASSPEFEHSEMRDSRAFTLVSDAFGSTGRGHFQVQSRPFNRLILKPLSIQDSTFDCSRTFYSICLELIDGFGITAPMLLAKRPKSAAENDDAPLPVSGTVTEMEAEVIGLFVQLSHLLGQPRSFAEIYGWLFISGQPLAMDDLIEHLHLSKGSASQGLKFLRNAGAIKMVYVPGDRRVHYEAVAELRKLVARFLRDYVVPQLDTSEARLQHIAGMVKQLPAGEREHIAPRITLLQSWEKKTRKFLPVVVKLLGG